MRDEPEFQVMMEKIKNDITKQLAQDKEMEPGDDVCVNLWPQFYNSQDNQS